MRGFRLALANFLRRPMTRRVVVTIALIILVGWWITGIFGLPGHWFFSLLVGVMIWINTIKLLIERSR